MTKELLIEPFLLQAVCCKGDRGDLLGLLLAVDESPNSLTQREIVADWLEEVGNEPRADFIRVQVELQKVLDDGGETAAVLSHRAAQLFQEHSDEWLKDLPTIRGVRWDRLGNFHAGLLEQITVWGSSLTSRLLESVAQTIPLRGLTVSGPFSLADLLSSPVLPELSRLSLDANYLSATDAKVLASSPAVAGLTELGLRGNPVHPQGALALLASPSFSGLERLDLSYTRLAARDAPSLVQGACPSRLRELDLRGNGMLDKKTADLLRARWPGVRVLLG